MNQFCNGSKFIYIVITSRRWAFGRLSIQKKLINEIERRTRAPFLNNVIKKKTALRLRIRIDTTYYFWSMWRSCWEKCIFVWFRLMIGLVVEKRKTGTQPRLYPIQCLLGLKQKKKKETKKVICRISCRPKFIVPFECIYSLVDCGLNRIKQCCLFLHALRVLLYAKWKCWTKNCCYSRHYFSLPQCDKHVTFVVSASGRNAEIREC